METTRNASRIPLLTEILCYVGAALVLTAGITVMREFWGDWSSGAQAIALGAGVLGFAAAGWPFRADPEEALSRMAGVLWLLSAVTMIWFLGVLVSDVIGVNGDDVAFWIGVGSSAFAAMLLAFRRGALQQIPLWVGGTISAFGFAIAFGPTHHFCMGTEAHWLAPSILVFGAAWLGATGLGVLDSTTTAVALGSATVLAAPVFAQGDFQEIAPIVGLMIAIVMLVASIVLRRVALLVCGGIGLFGYLQWAASEYFGSSVATPVALFVAGLAVLGIALVAARRLGGYGSPSPSSDS
jgi:hypothetical protein